MLVHILKFLCVLAVLHALPGLFGTIGSAVAAFIVMYAVWGMVE